MKHRGVLRLSPAPHPYGWVATPLPGYLQQYVAGVHLYSWVEKECGAVFLNICPGLHLQLQKIAKFAKHLKKTVK